MDKLYFTVFDYSISRYYWFVMPQHAQHIIRLFVHLTIFNEYINRVCGQSKIIEGGMDCFKKNITRSPGAN